jgi:hypothetical protein
MAIIASRRVAVSKMVLHFKSTGIGWKTVGTVPIPVNAANICSGLPHFDFPSIPDIGALDAL